MTIEELKRIEDLKQKRDEILRQIAVKKDVVREQKIKAAFSDFKRYFQEKGFEITDNSNMAMDPKAGMDITAKYGALSAEISSESFDTHYMGASFIFDIVLTLPKKTEYSVMLSSGSGWSKTKEIEQEIIEAQERLPNVANEPWVYILRQEKEKNTRNPYVDAPQFDSMYDLLAETAK